MISIAIIGRPNVGKSSIFNRLVGKKIAIVDSTAGVTRDRKESIIDIDGIAVKLIDTAGFETERPREVLAQKMWEQNQNAVKDSDLLLFVIDGIDGLTPDDQVYANIIRKTGKPVILIANKCENSKADSGVYDSFKLGFSNPIMISAEHGIGIGYVLEEISSFVTQSNNNDSNIDYNYIKNEQQIQVAIIGRPNVGKSTLINSLIGEERLITSPIAGTTRDSITVNYQHNNLQMKLVDTAGLRKKSMIQDRLEKMSVDETRHAIMFAQVVVVVIDAERPFEKQDITITNQAVKEGRAIVIAVNKWDKVKDKNAFSSGLFNSINNLFPEIKSVPAVFISALHGSKLDQLQQEIVRVYDLWNTRLTTGKLNDWLGKALEKHLVPLTTSNKRPKIKYITQIKTRPPTFALFGNMLNHIDPTYVRYLINSLREEFNLFAVPIRIVMKKSDNPYKP